MFRLMWTDLARSQKQAFPTSWVKTFLIFGARTICSTGKIQSEFALCKTNDLGIENVLCSSQCVIPRSCNYQRETLLSNRLQDACNLFEVCFFFLNCQASLVIPKVMSLWFPSNLETQDMSSRDPKRYQFKRSEPETVSIFSWAGAHTEWILTCGLLKLPTGNFSPCCRQRIPIFELPCLKLPEPKWC